MSDHAKKCPASHKVLHEWLPLDHARRIVLPHSLAHAIVQTLLRLQQGRHCQLSAEPTQGTHIPVACQPPLNKCAACSCMLPCLAVLNDMNPHAKEDVPHIHLCLSQDCLPSPAGAHPVGRMDMLTRMCQRMGVLGLISETRQLQSCAANHCSRTRDQRRRNI